MLEKYSELQPAFVNPLTNVTKGIDAIRVDGASDEGPTHDEVQYYTFLRTKEQPLLPPEVVDPAS